MNGSNVMIGEREFNPVLFFMAEVVFGFPVEQEVLGVTLMCWGVEFLFSLSAHL